MIRSYKILLAFLLAFNFCSVQRQILSIVTSNSTQSLVTYNNIKGAGLHGAGGGLTSHWDSIGTSFTVNYNATPNNVTSITQFSVNGLPGTFISWPTNAFIKVRRLANSYVNDASNHYNFWAIYSSIPAAGATSGTFNFGAPEILSPEDAFLSNNINSGYDNIFQNSINNLHAGNIERLDCIVADGLKPASYDISNAGVVVFDRGAGDPFKVAAILSLDNNNDPLTYGLVSVTAAQFGPSLLGSNFNYAIMTHDPKYGNTSRPSTATNQNIRGVFMTLGDLGLAASQRFYGYSVFGPDVTTANPDWTTYPNNTDFGSELDPVNVMNIFKDVNSLLSVPLTFQLTKQNNKPLLSFTIYDLVNNQAVAIERSANGRDFEEIGRQQITHSGQYYFSDGQALPGTSYYRLRLLTKNKKNSYSEVKPITLVTAGDFRIYQNPVRDIITLSLPENWRQKNITATLYNTSGARIQENNFNSEGGEIKLVLNKINSGNYILRLYNQQSGETQTKKLIVNH